MKSCVYQIKKKGTLWKVNCYHGWFSICVVVQDLFSITELVSAATSHVVPEKRRHEVLLLPHIVSLLFHIMVLTKFLPPASRGRVPHGSVTGPVQGVPQSRDWSCRGRVPPTRMGVLPRTRIGVPPPPTEEWVLAMRRAVRLLRSRWTFLFSSILRFEFLQFMSVYNPTCYLIIWCTFIKKVLGVGNLSSGATFNELRNETLSDRLETSTCNRR